MQIIIEKLRTGADKYDYSKLCEYDIQNHVSKVYNLKKGDVSKGFNPDFDFKLNNTSVELKISSKENLQIEYARDNGEPSGISVSKAKLYMTLTPGWTGKYQHVGKLRIFKTWQLQDCIEPLKDDPNHCIEYPPHDGGRGSRCVVITKEMLKVYKIDIGLLDIGLIKENTRRRVVGFDTDDIAACGNFSFVRGRVWNMIK